MYKSNEILLGKTGVEFSTDNVYMTIRTLGSDVDETSRVLLSVRDKDGKLKTELVLTKGLIDKLEVELRKAQESLLKSGLRLVEADLSFL